MSLKTTQSRVAENVHIFEQKQEVKTTIKVAAYCRVSTDMEIQQLSLDTQMAAYNKVIEEHPGWVLAGIYADKGISGTTVRHREEFKRMIEDAKAGKIDYILAKSMSRFSRNTVDALGYIRELKSYGVSVFFEKEKLDTASAVSEFLLSIFAAAAQEESQSLSTNMKLGKRMRYEAGIVQWTHVYGFRCGEDGKWLIEESEAKVIRRVFDEYTAGKSLPEICKGLMEDGIPSSGGKEVWVPKSLADILHNEKYMGDLRMQKSYISDPIQHIKVNNRDAKLKQYYKTGHHDAIVERRTYEMAQMISAMKDMHRGTSQYPYYGFLKCPICGKNMIRCAIPRNNTTFGWTCGGKPTKKGDLRKHRTPCPPYYILDEYIDSAFWDALQEVDARELTTILSSTDEEDVQAAQTMLELKKRAGKRHKDKVEYKYLCDTVQSFSFPQWSVIRIEWKCGLTSNVRLNFKKAADMPFPTITKEDVEHTVKGKGTFTLNTYVVNGVPLIKGCPDRQIEGITRAREAVQNTTILEPLSYEPPVPRVYGVKTTRNKGDGK